MLDKIADTSLSLGIKKVYNVTKFQSYTTNSPNPKTLQL
jgi:hypothetical protein